MPVSYIPLSLREPFSRWYVNKMLDLPVQMSPITRNRNLMCVFFYKKNNSYKLKIILCINASMKLISNCLVTINLYYLL